MTLETLAWFFFSDRSSARLSIVDAVQGFHLGFLFQLNLKVKKAHMEIKVGVVVL